MDKVCSYMFEELVPRVLTYYELIKLDVLYQMNCIKLFFNNLNSDSVGMFLNKFCSIVQDNTTIVYGKLAYYIYLQMYLNQFAPSSQANKNFTSIAGVLSLLILYTVYQFLYLPLFQDFFLAECCRLQFENAEPIKVGDTVVYTIYGFIPPQKLQDSNVGALTQTFFNGLTAKVSVDRQFIPAIKSYADEEYGKIRLLFTVEKGGKYKVQVRYLGFVIPGCPFYVTVPPDDMFAGESEVKVPSTPVLLTDSMPQLILISPRDRTGYPCNSEGIRLDLFDFHASTANSNTSICGKTCELIGRNWREVLEASFSLQENPGSSLDADTCRICLVLRISYSQPSFGLYEGQITYAGQPLKNGSFPIISLTKEEYEKLESTSTLPRPSDVVQFKAELIQPVESNLNANESENTEMENSNENEKTKEVYVNISLKFICIKEVLWRVILSRTAIFKIQGETKVEAVPENEGKLQYIIVISDETQHDLRVRMTASNARVFMALYLKFRAHVTGNGGTYSEKLNAFLGSLKTHCMKQLSSKRERHQFFQISRPDALRTSYEGTKLFDCEKWYSPFIVSFIGEPLLEDESAWLEWSELVLGTCFENNSLGMFHKISERSAFVHPNPARNIRSWGIQYYELCGKILGKYLVERALNHKSKNYRVKVRFSRSFLQQLIGSNPTALTLERDMPELYDTLVTTLNNTDLENGLLTFAVPEYDVFGKLEKMVPIIEHGGAYTVTKENLDLYLNALARYHLGSKVTREIEAFRAGFSFIVPEDLLLNFDENELELLLCGWSNIDLHEMKRHHKVDGEHWHPEFPRIMKWLWTSLGNMLPVDQAKFLQFCTGSSILPLGEFAQLTPQLTFCMTCLYGQLPAAEPSAHRICLSDHPNYEAFNEALLTSIRTAACCQPKPKPCEHVSSEVQLAGQDDAQAIPSL
ncbi:Apoptosis-resistant E3 ubiquitin protein ligase 1 [Orchesella cincta]|uniref:HECT-type E3 ubiquitin transferase n=1 Tax=Orchesella cincta TaxID=48709 RepID=A0A1D2NKM7_ORCCI|nr:Apoptosis-resistant E3 ubiquitin protein ligase 1 [Orchesella cincta]